MPKRSGRRRKKARSSRVSISGTDKIERVPGKVLVQVTAFTTAIPLNISALGARLTTLGTVFQEHRFTSIRAVLHPGFATGSITRTGYVAGYFKVIPLIPPTTAANLYQGVVSRLNDVGDTVPVSLSLRRRELMGNVRTWYTNTVTSGSTLLDSTQGIIYIIGNGNSVNGLNATVEVSFVCEFRGPTLPPVE